ncbi:DUF881 domain-containing protein [Cellulomonas septica]|uniref:DUF881 domain-containing protein n=1 Tax=Cellulomonas septica TaxID=285080 RepID=A0ABX1K0G6_9CELL|nr:DUF881 domain-containing protein [Cellulomonas septica]NKY39797.1 DUF881 domain-containing protein [Cellulomonas septica]
MTSRHGDAVQRPAPDASMTLLNEVYRRPLDPGYAAAAEGRRTGTRPPRTRRGAALLLVLGVLLGLGTVTAAVSLRTPPPSVVAARNLLQNQIEQHDAEAEALESDIAALSDEVRGLQEAALDDVDPALAAELEASQIAAGVVPVTGTGLRIVLTDAPVDPDSGVEAPSSRVQDYDLQVLVNGLWAAGAEAVAINGERLTATSAIRSSGPVVRVDLVPLVSPYVVEAVGDPVAMQTDIARSSAGQLLATLRNTWGIGVDMSSQTELELPGAGQVKLHDATVPEESRLTPPTPSTTSDEPPATEDAGASAEGADEAAGVAGSARHPGRERT